MIDVHTHILPSIDDGPETNEESMEICKAAANDGIKKIVAKPHLNNGVYEPKSAEIIKAVDALNTQLAVQQIDIDMLPGAEIHISDGLVESVKNGDVLTINNGGKFILLELPFAFVPPGTDKFIFNLKVNGIIPILAHAERAYNYRCDSKCETFQDYQNTENL